ncbi:MAG TPA: plastocyanin/azurin family copper-binding protein [Vicinamibacterales bacterium]|nr:plastocyanin/azurin family copper-binding protein [Vicinamibacterales bacterium]
MSLRCVALLAAFALVSACGSSSNAPTSPTPNPTSGATATIPSGASTMTATAFGANPLTVTAGTTVTWVNADNTTHTATSDNGVFNSGNINPGGRFSTTFATAGTFAYHCTIHPNMVGTVKVQ